MSAGPDAHFFGILLDAAARVRVAQAKNVAAVEAANETEMRLTRANSYLRELIAYQTAWLMTGERPSALPRLTPMPKEAGE